MSLLNVGVLACGDLGLTGLATLFENSSVRFVLSDTNSKEIARFCRERDIPVFVGNPRDGRSATFLNDFRVDLLVSINYLFIIDSDILNRPAIAAVNFHGSLLPRYRGRTPHVWAIINNERETGVTAHLMDEGCDTGDVLLQRKLRIGEDETGGELLRRMTELCPEMICELLKGIQNDTLERHPQDHSRATRFGRRGREDGRIDWSWHRERIHNWIRAQAFPYPWAFFLYENREIAVHGSRLSDAGFDSATENGTVLTQDPLIVKVSNGAIMLEKHEFDSQRTATDRIVFQ